MMSAYISPVRIDNAKKIYRAFLSDCPTLLMEARNDDGNLEAEVIVDCKTGRVSSYNPYPKSASYVVSLIYDEGSDEMPIRCVKSNTVVRPNCLPSNDSANAELPRDFVDAIRDVNFLALDTRRYLVM